jgi:hypothetical protein
VAILHTRRHEMRLPEETLQYAGGSECGDTEHARGTINRELADLWLVRQVCSCAASAEAPVNLAPAGVVSRSRPISAAGRGRGSRLRRLSSSGNGPRGLIALIHVRMCRDASSAHAHLTL